MDKLRKFDDWLLLFCFVLNAVCVVTNLAKGGNPVALAMNAFAGGAALSAIFFDRLHKKAMKLCDQYHEAAIKAHDVARSALLQSITIMGQQVDRYKKGE